MSYSFQTPLWCYISVGGHPDVTSGQGCILADYDQHFSCGWDSFDTKLIEIFPPNFVLMLYIRRWQTGVTSVQGAILADDDQNFSRGWDSPDTKVQLPQRPRNYVPLTLYVEILFWANALRTPYWLSWCHVSLRWHIELLRLNWYTCPEVKSCQVWLS